MNYGAKFRATLGEMVQGVLTDPEIMTEAKRNQIIKALEITAHHTSTYALQVSEVVDILGRDSAHSGWYIKLEGCWSGVNIFVNNDMEIVRKPSKNACKVCAVYSLYNDSAFDEGFWYKNFR